MRWRLSMTTTIFDGACHIGAEVNASYMWNDFILCLRSSISRLPATIAGLTPAREMIKRYADRFGPTPLWAAMELRVILLDINIRRLMAILHTMTHTRFPRHYCRVLCFQARFLISPEFSLKVAFLSHSILYRFDIPSSWYGPSHASTHHYGRLFRRLLMILSQPFRRSRPRPLAATARQHKLI